jgi:hypothetical protein
MLASAISFTVMTMLIKFLGDDYPSPLQTFYRQLAGLLAMVLSYWDSCSRFRPRGSCGAGRALLISRYSVGWECSA